MLKIVAVVLGAALVGSLGGLLLALLLTPLFPKGLPAPLAAAGLLVATGMLIWWAVGFMVARKP